MTETHVSAEPRTDRSGRAIGGRIPVAVVAIGSAAVTVAGYLLLLGWHQERELAAGAIDETGPYQPWQVVALVGVLAVLAAASGWLRRPGAVTIAVPVALTATWIADAVTIPSQGDANIWPIGAFLVAVAAFAGIAAVAYGAAAVRRWVQ
ncbi:hypothetical protein [Micromonospora sp. NBC_01813]|uniref:hypothetical protein n=1 Tax=Micromonospora sp. NBC_01813 TaxID=2975988 RepID=UPI002DD96B66|nr:hypothetical protein [Micromonospora sp. NBC_01813]WSA06524.1 hypothetical protein OG958_19705 [Micromonospora sp. NBC_01813]